MAEHSFEILHASGYSLQGDGMRPQRLFGWNFQRRNRRRNVLITKSGAGLLLRMGAIVGTDGYEALGVSDPRDTLNKRVAVYAALPYGLPGDEKPKDRVTLKPVMDSVQFVTGVAFEGMGFVVDPSEWRNDPHSILSDVEPDIAFRGQFDPSGTSTMNRPNYVNAQPIK